MTGEAARPTPDRCPTCGQDAWTPWLGVLWLAAIVAVIFAGVLLLRWALGMESPWT